MMKILSLQLMVQKRLFQIQPIFYFTGQLKNKDNEESALNKYKFNSQVIGIPFDFPVFPYSQIKFTVSNEQLKVIKRHNHSFIASIVRKSSDIRDLNFTKPTDNNITDKNYLTKPTDNNWQNDFYDMATYCSCQIVPHPFTQEITLFGRHRVLVKKLTLVQQQQTNNEQIQTMEQSKQEENLTKDKYIPSQLSMITKQNKLQTFQKLSVYLAEVEPHILLTNVINDLSLHAKVKLLLDLQMKIIKNVTHVEPISNVNLNSIETILDSMCGFLSTLNYYTKQILWDLYQEQNMHQKIDKLLVHTNNYLYFTRTVTDIGQMATENIKQKKIQEFFSEVFNVVKNAVEGQKGRKSIIQRLSTYLKGKTVPVQVQEIFKSQAKRLLTLDEHNPEAILIQNYLEWVASLPYGVNSPEEFDIQKAKKVLDSDHYGMKEVKLRILELIAIGKHTGKLHGKIMCLVGPPGTGKTSFARSIARALGREYVRISLGGESDSSVLKGHRKTYIGSYPGKIICALKEAKTENCVILLDEIDKLGRQSMHGDPSNTLLEILDPSQNNSFVDNYLDFPVDLSKVIFICSANMTDPIPAPLLDRMDIIHLRSYTTQEKFMIYKRHILPNSQAYSGLQVGQFSLQDDAIKQILIAYAREPGVRSLQKYIDQILGKIAFEIVSCIKKQEDTSIINITKNNLISYIGRPKFSDSKIFNTQIGIALGLAYTQMGGSLIYIETIATKIKNQQQANALQCSGRLGKVIKESMNIAYTYAKHFAATVLNNNYFQQHNIHIHAPDSGTHKDGPSAGITIVTALLSLALAQPIKSDIGMTGEVSLFGNVMKIGGVKEKVIAASREGLKECIFPFDNQNEVEQLDKELTQGIKFHFVKNYNDVFNLVLKE